MAILTQDFETLVTAHGTERCDFGALLEKSREIKERWQDDTVINADKINFSLDENLRFHYTTDYGKDKVADITEYGFSQLCARLGVPSNYIKKCFETGKQDLALQNFRAWAGETDSNMLVRANDGVVRAVLSDKYSVFDSYQVLRALKYTVDFKRWEPTQTFLSEDRFVARFVDFTPLPVNDGSPLFLGFTAQSSDVGRGALKITAMIYRSVCTNGLLISSLGGTLFKQAHVGSAIAASKLAAFNEVFENLDVAARAIVDNIGNCRRQELKDYEMDMYLEKAKREMKLSEKSVDKLQGLILNTYEPTKWGIVNALTELAQDFTLERRLEIESFAGDFFARAA